MMATPETASLEQIDEENAAALARMKAMGQMGAPPPALAMPAPAIQATGEGAVLPPAALMPGGFPGGAPTGIPGTPAATPAAVVTAPQAGPGGVPGAPGAGLDPGILRALGTPGGSAGSVRAAGFSPADRAVDAARRGQLGEEAEHARTQIETIKDLAKAQADESEQGNLDMRLASQKYNQEQQENARKRAELASDAKEVHVRIQNELAQQEAKGVDPNHYWSLQSTPSKILAAISVGLGAFAAHGLGPHGQPSENTALNIINAAVSQDIDAQKVNLARGLEVARMKGLLNTEGFNRQDAMLKAEQDSIQTGYSVAMNDITKRAGMFQNNTEALQKAASMVAGLQSVMDDKVGRVIEQRYALAKNAERPVATAGTGDKLRQEILALASDKVKRAQEKGVSLPITQAFREAFEEKTGSPGSREGFATAQPFPQKGAAGAADKGAAAESARQNILGAVRELETLNKQAGLTGLWSPTAQARAQALQTTIALEYNRAHGINRVGAEAEQHRLAERVIPDLTSRGVEAARQAKLDLLKGEFGKPLKPGEAASVPEETKEDLEKY